MAIDVEVGSVGHIKEEEYGQTKGVAALAQQVKREPLLLALSKVAFVKV
jgi:hypothetical protein